MLGERVPALAPDDVFLRRYSVGGHAVLTRVDLTINLAAREMRGYVREDVERSRKLEPEEVARVLSAFSALCLEKRMGSAEDERIGGGGSFFEIRGKSGASKFVSFRGRKSGSEYFFLPPAAEAALIENWPSLAPTWRL